MLQRQSMVDRESDQEVGFDLSLPYIWSVVKRRLWWFAVPFLLILTVGSLVAWKWPAQYVASGTILVRSADVPANLVRSTVVGVAAERIAIIRQRIMTRDNLIGLAKKFGITPSWRAQITGTPIVDFIRDRTLINQVDTRQPGQRAQAIAFTVGFEYENPVIATKVANELMTMMLAEDANSRRTSATETTKFIDANVKRLEAKLAQIDSEITDAVKRRRAAAVSGIDGIDASAKDVGKTLEALKAQLVLKRATLSDSHPDIRALKSRIQALEKEQMASDGKLSPKASATDAQATDLKSDKEPDIRTLITKRDSLKEELGDASQKLALARQGESLERNQYAERLEVIEQPTVPSTSVKPNRTKLFVFAIALAFFAGGASAGGMEFFSGAIYRDSDLRAFIDPAIIVSVPYITTQRELRNSRRNRIIKTMAIAITLIGAAVAFYIFVPDPDLLVDKLIRRFMQ